MFPQSSQRNYWMFSDESDLTALREKTNAEFIEKHGANMTVSPVLYLFIYDYNFLFCLQVLHSMFIFFLL